MFEIDKDNLLCQSRYMIQTIASLVLFAIIFNCGLANAIEPECVDWFKAGKVSSTSKDCMMDCASLGVDMGTFTCPMSCDELCRPQISTCEELKSKIKIVFKEGRPGTWERDSERAKAWRQDEKDQVIKALSRLLRPESFEIFRMVKSVTKGNPASNLGSSIALYDDAFNGALSLDRVLGHELAHLYYRSLGDRAQGEYATAANWIETKPGGPFVSVRKASEFVAEDGVTSPEEDFANNVEEALMDNSRLKKVSPGVHNWLHLFFGDSLKLGGPCALSPKAVPKKAK